MYVIIQLRGDFMIVKEYGKSNKDIIILLHGGGLSWWNYEEVSEILSGYYHGDLSINHPNEYAEKVKKLIK